MITDGQMIVSLSDPHQGNPHKSSSLLRACTALASDEGIFRIETQEICFGCLSMPQSTDSLYKLHDHPSISLQGMVSL